jgi:hypothetical protein
VNPRPPAEQAFPLYRLAHPGDKPEGTIWTPEQLLPLRANVTVYTTLVEPHQLAADLTPDEMQTLGVLSDDPHWVSLDAVKAAHEAVLVLPQPWDTEWLVGTRDGDEEWIWIGGRQTLPWTTAKLADC